MSYTTQQLEELENYCTDEGINYEAFLAYLDNIHQPDDWEEHKLNYQYDYVGQYSDGAEFARQIVDEVCDIDEYLTRYFDYDAYWRDLMYGGEYWISDDGHIFRG